MKRAVIRFSGLMWTCKVCNESFHEHSSYEKHWESEMQLLAEDAHAPAPPPPPPLPTPFIRKQPNSSKKGIRETPFKSPFDTLQHPEEKKINADASIFASSKSKCPICNKLFPLKILQQHVEHELQAMPQEFSNSGTKHAVSRGVLVLGDDPKPGGRPRKRMKQEVNNVARFNHYADGKGWWSEDAAGVDSTEIGGCMSWEGVGSVSYEGFGPSF